MVFVLDEKDVQIIRTLLKEEIGASEGRVTKHTEKIIQESEQRMTARTESMIDAAEQRIAKSTVALMDAEFKPKFDLLAEGIQDIQEKMVPRSRVDDLEDEVKFLKSVVRQINEDVQKLKRAT